MGKMTIEDVLKITIDSLSRIEVPVSLAEKVGVEIARNVENLRQCVIAIEQSKEVKPEEEKDDGTEREADAE